MDNSVRAQEQRGQQRALLSSLYVDYPASALHQERSEQGEAHFVAGRRDNHSCAHS
jgi:hypothetical protein